MKAFLIATVMALAMLETHAFADTGLVTKQSKYTVRETVERFEAEVKAKAADGWIVFSEIDHAAATKEVGLEMRPRTLIIFGNPKGGTPLMQAAQTLGIDLPLKALVWQDGTGKTWIGYNDPRWLARRHAVTGYEPILDAMTKALQAVAGEAC